MSVRVTQMSEQPSIIDLLTHTEAMAKFGACIMARLGTKELEQTDNPIPVVTRIEVSKPEPKEGEETIEQGDESDNIRLDLVKAKTRCITIITDDMPSLKLTEFKLNNEIVFYTVGKVISKDDSKKEVIHHTHHGSIVESKKRPIVEEVKKELTKYLPL